MIYGQTFKSVSFVAITSAATNATSSARIDAQGAHGIIIKATHKVATATDSSAKWTVLQALVGDDTNYSNATAVNGLVGTTNSTASTSQFVLAAHNDTSNPSVTKLGINNLRNRYVFIQWQAPTGYNTVCIDAELYRLDQAPSSATEAGVAAYAYAT